jgi:hypothetical protein
MNVSCLHVAHSCADMRVCTAHFRAPHWHRGSSFFHYTTAVNKHEARGMACAALAAMNASWQLLAAQRSSSLLPRIGVG